MWENYDIIDITQPLFAGMPTWGGSCGFMLEIKSDYDRLFRVNRLQMDAGIGTHMDAPNHLIKGGMSIDELPLSQCLTQACILNVSNKDDPDYEISVQDIEEYERRYGAIPKNALVVGYTGWGRYWRDTIAYRNADSSGNMHFPAFSAKAAEVLLKKDVAGIAIDTLSPDCGDAAFPVHHLMLGAGKYIIENVGDCSKIPVQGAYISAFPLKIEKCTESPVRMVALVPS